MLELKNICFSADGKQILNNVNLTIDDRKFIVITGPNGSGKSTLAKIIAGIVTFLAMAYILAVNPGMLGESGMGFGPVFTATAISAAVASLCMAFFANLPVALASGMGLNAFFTYTVVFGMGCSWQFALTAVLIEGILSWEIVYDSLEKPTQIIGLVPLDPATLTRKFDNNKWILYISESALELNDLKEEYDENDKDKIVERVIILVESGQL